MGETIESRPVGRPPKQIDQRQRILQQAAKAIATVGYEQCSLADIAAELELTRPALYHYFSTKQQIFVDIALATVEETYTFVSERVDPTLTADRQLHDLMIAHAEYFESNYWLVNATIVGYAGIARRELAHLEQFERYRKKYADLLHKIIRLGIREKIFRRVDVQATGLSIFQLLNISRWYRPGRAKSAVKIAEENFALLFGGIKN